MTLEISQSTLTGWILVFISTTACVLGASIVFIDRIWHRRQGSILSSRTFLASSMALASGVLLVSSLTILLPESQVRLNSTSKAYSCFLGGAMFTLVLSRIIHWCTPDAIHACGSQSPTNIDDDLSGTLSTSTSSSSSSSSPTMVPRINHQNTPTVHHNNITPKSLSLTKTKPIRVEEQEQQTLILPENSPTLNYGSTVLHDAHFRFHEHNNPNMTHSLEEQQQHHSNENQKHLHHHHVNNHSHTHHHHKVHNVHDNDDNDNLDFEQEKQQFWSIGIQTAVAICVHKFPEGLIMFISSQASSSLGVSVAAAMSIHNLTEGFMMALPIYYATGSRPTAFLCASLMGGLSQPIGALIGLLAFRSVTKDQEDMLFGVTFGIISGMMTFITVQSMLPQAIKVDTHQSHVVIFFFLGVFLVGLTSLLKTI
ncbi:Zinc/iron permease [Halteromyces radiatus]|uniref:Zinc/iron permease n=1 Tax=Halteromyces radiatus TaxID=101107 RepID=UPI00221EDF98|nr:Zinc/iron permease [Halteromyces radiatus]KAI8084770.1 Zinc/iron permease [Halteromyces radiatus]